VSKSENITMSGTGYNVENEIQVLREEVEKIEQKMETLISFVDVLAGVCKALHDKGDNK
jgi:archaellum component FlaC